MIPGMVHRFGSVLLGLLAASCVSAQEREVALVEVALPAEHKADNWVPAVMLWWSGDDLARTKLRDSLTGSGFAVAVLDGTPEPRVLGAALMDLRQRVRIAQGGLHAVIAAGEKLALASLLAHRHEFQTVTVCGVAASADLAPVRRLRTRRVRSMATTDATQLRDHLLAWHKERQVAGVAGKVSRTLDSFHDAAAVADEDRYFAILPNDSVFLGTDATERWTGKEFRAFAMRYFKLKSAWTYVPLERHVTLSSDGKMAWFDEALDNASYGECRGTGVLVERDGRWVLLQYNLTVPVPNDLLGGVAKQIRAHLDGAKLDGAQSGK